MRGRRLEALLDLRGMGIKTWSVLIEGHGRGRCVHAAD